MSARAPKELVLYYERSPGHSYLYDIYAEAAKSRLITPRYEPWEHSKAMLPRTTSELARAFAEARELDASLVLLTLDAFLHPGFRAVLKEGVALAKRPVAGILHRYAYWPKDDPELLDIAGSMRVCVLATEAAERTVQHAGFLPLVLPHHPSIVTVPPLPHRQKPDRVVVSLIGELREGKGLGLVLETMRMLGPELIGRLHFRFGGRADVATEALVTAAVAETGASADIRLRASLGQDYDVLSAIEFADMIYDTDIGLVLYQEAQREVMSGVLPNFVATGAVSIGTRNSIVGSIVATNGLGIAIADETPEALKTALIALVEPEARAAMVASPHYAAYRQFTSPANVVRTLRGILELGKERV